MLRYGTKKPTEDKSREMDTAAEPRPGDDDFDGFRMRLPEDCVEYMLFVIGDKAERALPSLETVRRAADQKLAELAGDYIWQRESFRLETKVQRGTFLLFACSHCSTRAARHHELTVSEQGWDFPISTALPTTGTTSRTSGLLCTYCES